MAVSDSDHIEKLIQIHRQRLQVLQEQQAMKGLETPPSILIEIENIKAEIGKLQKERKTDPYSGSYSSVIPEHQGTTTDDKMMRARTLRRQARTEYDNTNYLDAEEQLRLAIQLDPDEASSWGLFGRVLNRLGKYDEAVPALSKAIELTQLNQTLYMLHRGVAYTMLGKYGRALEDFENRIKIRPKGYRAFRWRAMVWLYLHRPENALVDVDRCISLKPEYICAHATKAIALYQLGRMEDAANELEIIDTLHPEDEGDFYCLALAYSKLKVTVHEIAV